MTGFQRARHRVGVNQSMRRYLKRRRARADRRRAKRALILGEFDQLSAIQPLPTGERDLY